MSQVNSPIRLIISGGGTGGHLFPAIAIAQKVKERYPDAEILFVGALGKIEMEKVPKYGFAIEGLWISGFYRGQMGRNLALPFKIINSLWRSARIIRQFKPNIAVGVGGYASATLLYMANNKGIPTLLQEQNSYPGVTNKILAPKAKAICVAFEGMEKFFQKEKLKLTGNPLRANIQQMDKSEAKRQLGFKEERPLLLIIGGSLGAKTLNDSLEKDFKSLLDAGIQVYWQCGKLYHESLMARIDAQAYEGQMKIMPFIEDMNAAYGAADLVISRSGALSISEITFLGKASILVPSPNVAQDHQTKNAEALAHSKATAIIKDSDAREKLCPEAIQLIQDPTTLLAMEKQAKNLALPHAATEIVQQIQQIVHG